MALQGEAKKAYQRELMRKRRAEKVVSDLGLKEPESESTVPRTEMTVGVEKRDSLELFEQRCDLCNRTWSASTPIICPYCHGKIKKVIPV